MREKKEERCEVEGGGGKRCGRGRRGRKGRGKGERNKDLKNIKNVKRCRDGMPKSMQTR